MEIGKYHIKLDSLWYGNSLKDFCFGLFTIDHNFCEEGCTRITILNFELVIINKETFVSFLKAIQK